MKRCSRCDTEKPLDGFSRMSRSPDGRHYYCRPCRADHERRYRRQYRTRADNLKRSFGITPEDYERMFAAQGGVCAICGLPERISRQGTPRHLCVDHDHETGEVRALLCNDCNRGIGAFGDDPALVEVALSYLLAHRPMRSGR